jgi:hypothetical protein
MEEELEKGNTCLCIRTDSCLSSFLSYGSVGRVLYVSFQSSDSYLPVKHVKHVAPLHGLSVLATHWKSLDTVVIRDLDKMCPEYMVLLHLLRYWKRHRVLIVSPTPPPLSFLQCFFPDMVLVPEASPTETLEVRYLMDDMFGHSLTFHFQRHKFEEWFMVNGSLYQRIVIYVATMSQIEVIRFYLKVVYPHFFVVTANSETLLNEESTGPIVFLTTGWGDEVPCTFSPDLVVDFGRFQRKCRGYYGPVELCPKNVMLRRQHCLGARGLVLRLLTSSEFENRPSFFPDVIPKEWVPWTCFFLASVGLCYRSVLCFQGPHRPPMEKWQMNLEGSSRKRLKTFLQYPFSIRSHLMLERCRGFKVQNEIQRSWIVLAITLVNWFDHHHRFLLPKKSFHELQCIYGNDDELFIHMRIAILVLSGSPLIHMDFIDAACVGKKFCQHFHKGNRLVFPPKSYPLLPSIMTEEDKDIVRYFFMTDPRVERVYPVDANIHSYFNTISFISLTLRNHAVVLLLCTASSEEENDSRMTLWTHTPSDVTRFHTTLVAQLQEKHQEEGEKKSQKAFFRDRVIRYFQEVLSLATW